MGKFSTFSFYYWLVVAFIPILTVLFGIDYDPESIKFWTATALGVYVVAILAELRSIYIKKKRGGV